MFCGLNYDEFNKISYFVGSIMTNSIKRHKVLGLGSISSNSSQIVCNCDAPLKCHKIFVINHHISCSASILVIGFPFTYPLKRNGLKCLRSLSSGFSNVDGTRSNGNCTTTCSMSSSDGALNPIGRIKTMLTEVASTSSAFSLARHTCVLER